MALRATRFIGVWLMADGLLTALWFAGLANSLGGRDSSSVAAMSARLVVAALSIVAGWFISQRRPAGAALGTGAAAFIAVFSVLDAATGILPSNLDPSFRWPVAGLHVAAATLAILSLERNARETM